MILADLTVEGGAVTGIDCDSHRRYVAWFGGFYFRCEAEKKATPEDIRQRLRQSLRPDALKAFEESGGLIAPPARQRTGDRLAVDGIEENTALGRRIQELTIAEIAGQGREAFVNAMVSVTSESRRALVKKQADEIWIKAADVVVTLSPG